MTTVGYGDMTAVSVCVYVGGLVAMVVVMVT